MLSATTFCSPVREFPNCYGLFGAEGVSQKRGCSGVRCFEFSFVLFLQRTQSTICIISTLTSLRSIPAARQYVSP